MERVIGQWKKSDPGVMYRGESPTRLDNLTDAVFGIAITLLITNVTNPNSFDTLLDFTKTFPAFLISIIILMLAVPCFSILLAFSLKFASITRASILSGMAYGLYVPTIMIWSKKIKLRKEELLQNDLKGDD